MMAPERAGLPLNVSRETHRRLSLFVGLLLEWTQTVNLMGRSDVATVWNRHIGDSLQLARLLAPFHGPLVDLGSGAGFPGLVLSIATGWHVHLIESDHRKAAFLREATRLTGAPACVHASRIEDVRLPAVEIVTARALAPLPVLLDYAERFLRPGGICLFPKGRKVEEELTAARKQWHMRVRRESSWTDPGATILHLSEISRVQNDK